jgi:hypothetical protein
MRLARKLFLLAAMAIAAMALTAPSAFAQNVEVEDEATDLHCPQVTLSANGHDVTGGCEIHAISEDNAVLRQHTVTGEVAISSCQNEFVGHVNENGLGYIASQELSPVGPPCGLTPCDEVGSAPPNAHEDLPWPLGLFELGGGVEVLTTTFCVRNVSLPEGSQGTPCSVVVNTTTVGHAYEFSANEAACTEFGGALTLTGHWVTEGNNEEGESFEEVIIHHLD